MVGQEIGVGTLGFRGVPVGEISQLVGGPETESVGIYLTVSGSASGHIMLMYDPQMAHGFVDMLMGQPPGSTQSLGDMEASALGELGNIMGSSFLNALADATGLTLMPSPPIVMRDMAGALLDVIAADILLTQDDAFVAETSFNAPDRDITGQFFVIPTRDLLKALMDSREAA
jgi:chemotaxis protein CheC